jgi:hypothetical protein
MKESLAFDHRPDAVLGDALRQALDPGDAAPFVARVLARAEQVRATSWDTVLARWSRLGVAAAAVVALAAGYVVGRAGIAAPAAQPSVAETLLAPPAPADVGVVLASVIDN